MDARHGRSRGPLPRAVELTKEHGAQADYAKLVSHYQLASSRSRAGCCMTSLHRLYHAA
jgi:hypothetical protein